jgi:hypothetical protein
MRGKPALLENGELIQKVQGIFWEKGYIATSLTDLLSATGEVQEVSTIVVRVVKGNL